MPPCWPMSASKCAGARSSASPGWSAPAAPKWRERSSAPTRSIPVASSSTASEVRIRSPQDAIRHGIGLVPEDRKQQALFLALAVRTNLSMASHQLITRWGVFIDEAAERPWSRSSARSSTSAWQARSRSIANLSGGNQQKVVLARWLALGPKVLIVDEPTRGIDIGAKVEVHDLLFELARSGIAVIAISSELPEVLAISDRIVTMREGRVTGEIKSEDANEEILMSMMTLSTQSSLKRARRR